MMPLDGTDDAADLTGLCSDNFSATNSVTKDSVRLSFLWIALNPCSRSLPDFFRIAFLPCGNGFVKSLTIAFLPGRNGCIDFLSIGGSISWPISSDAGLDAFSAVTGIARIERPITAAFLTYQKGISSSSTPDRPTGLAPLSDIASRCGARRCDAASPPASTSSSSSAVANATSFQAANIGSV